MVLPEREQHLPQNTVEEIIASINDHINDNKDAYNQVPLIHPEEYKLLLNTINSDSLSSKLTPEVSHYLDESIQKNDYGEQLLNCFSIIGSDNMSPEASRSQVRLACLMLSHLSKHEPKELSDELIRVQNSEFENEFKKDISPDDLKEVSSWFLSKKNG
jgi:hypothetical protein